MNNVPIENSRSNNIPSFILKDKKGKASKKQENVDTVINQKDREDISKIYNQKDIRKCKPLFKNPRKAKKIMSNQYSSAGVVMGNVEKEIGKKYGSVADRLKYFKDKKQFSNKKQKKDFSYYVPESFDYSGSSVEEKNIMIINALNKSKQDAIQCDNLSITADKKSSIILEQLSKFDGAKDAYNKLSESNKTKYMNLAKKYYRQDAATTINVDSDLLPGAEPVLVNLLSKGLLTISDSNNETLLKRLGGLEDINLYQWNALKHMSDNPKAFSNYQEMPKEHKEQFFEFIKRYGYHVHKELVQESRQSQDNFPRCVTKNTAVSMLESGVLTKKNQKGKTLMEDVNRLSDISIKGLDLLYHLSQKKESLNNYFSLKSEDKEKFFYVGGKLNPDNLIYSSFSGETNFIDLLNNKSLLTKSDDGETFLELMCLEKDLYSDNTAKIYNIIGSNKKDLNNFLSLSSSKRKKFIEVCESNFCDSGQNEKLFVGADDLFMEILDKKRLTREDNDGKSLLDYLHSSRYSINEEQFESLSIIGLEDKNINEFLMLNSKQKEDYINLSRNCKQFEGGESSGLDSIEAGMDNNLWTLLKNGEAGELFKNIEKERLSQKEGISNILKDKENFKKLNDDQKDKLESILGHNLQENVTFQEDNTYKLEVAPDARILSLLDSGYLTKKDYKGNTLLENLYSLQKQKFVEGVSPKVVFNDVLEHITKPEVINQANRNTCTVATIQYMLAKNPDYKADYTKIVSGLFKEEGCSKLVGDDLFRSKGALTQDNSSRDIVERVFQVSLMDYANGSTHYDNQAKDGRHYKVVAGDRDYLKKTGLVEYEVDKVLDSVLPHESTYEIITNGSFNEESFNKKVKGALNKGISVPVTVNWPQNPHQLLLYKMDDQFVYLRNPWGKDDGDLEHGPPRESINKNGQGGLVKMKKEDFYAHLRSYFVPE